MFIRYGNFGKMCNLNSNLIYSIYVYIYILTFSFCGVEAKHFVGQVRRCFLKKKNFQGRSNLQKGEFTPIYPCKYDPAHMYMNSGNWLNIPMWSKCLKPGFYFQTMHSKKEMQMVCGRALRTVCISYLFMCTFREHKENLKFNPKIVFGGVS